MLDALLFLVLTPIAVAQPPSPSQAVPPVTLPTVVVTAQKEPADAQRLPVSVTALSSEVIGGADISTVAAAAAFSPNTRVAELSARKVSNPFIRGIGSSPSNPGVTTYIDGIPQLNTSSSSVEFLDIERIEFVRGPQSALFGRNTLGGLISLSSARPSLSSWTGQVAVPIGSARAREVRAGASGPVGESLALGLSLGHSQRDGFTINDVTGHAIDSRSATFGKARVLWVPGPSWEARLIVSGERARDGDYALQDLGELRRNPFHVMRDYEGRTDRDVWSTAALLRKEGRRLAFSSTTGYVSWTARDLTDLDYTAMPLMTRDNAEEDRQVTQEFRLASAKGAPARLSGRVALAWQTGLFLFTQDYGQHAINHFSPGVLSPVLGFPIDQHSPEAALDDTGLGVYGQGTLTVGEALGVTLGARLDHERKAARIGTDYAPPIAPPIVVDAERSFADVSPQAALAWRFTTDRMAYVSIARGFKAGGFNPASPPGTEAYGEEHAWNLEGGVKTARADGRVSANAAVFRIAWEDLQLNVPNPLVPAQFYIANVGGARSSGVEVDVRARPRAGIDVSAAFGVTHARFASGSQSGGVDVSDNELPNAPGYTLSLGAQYSREVGRAASCYGRADVVFYGAYHYDDLNRAGQEAYSLANLRGGLRNGRLSIEGWMENAFDTRYVPVAFAYGSLAPSGFVGENGRPRTFGVTARLAF